MSYMTAMLPLLESDSSELRQIHAQIASHVEAALRLRRDLNACAPINQLPSAALARIFVHQATAIQDDNLPRFEMIPKEETERAAHKSVYAWLNVARVCRHWGEIALRCPEHRPALAARAVRGAGAGARAARRRARSLWGLAPREMHVERRRRCKPYRRVRMAKTHSRQDDAALDVLG
ncbi:hypothetical protein GY45DRAFT_476073 [Cubamyces sp. BRFM 1775]|nr:hypothetical protein GY45DRAFT_476073 [Cubamyces sp. BRFM 1775]